MDSLHLSSIMMSPIKIRKYQKIFNQIDQHELRQRQAAEKARIAARKAYTAAIPLACTTCVTQKENSTLS